MVGRIAETLRGVWLRRRHRRDLHGLSYYTSDSPTISTFIRARALARSGLHPMATKLFAEACLSDPTLCDAWEARGALLDVMGKTECAAAMYDAARKARTRPSASTADRHFVFRQRGSLLAEIFAYDSVLISIRKNTLPYVARGNAYLAIGRPQQALANYDRALRLKRNAPEIMALKGESLSMLGRYQDALQAFDAALAVRPDDVESLSGRAIVRAATGAIDGANADWRRQLQLQRGPASARACIALRMADYELALPELEQALSLEPLEPYWSLYRMTAHSRLGLPIVSGESPGGSEWPGPLLDLHAGRATEAQVLSQAGTDVQRAEALFQAGVVSFPRDRVHAAQCWRKVLDVGAPSLIEYGAARNELARLGS
jgi:tetratricopeptide (TPR) repeat protein